MPSDLIHQYLGTVPQWGVLGAVIIATLRLWPRMRELGISEADKLREELRAQAAECEATKGQLIEQIRRLNETVLGIRRQHLDEQIRLVSLLMRSSSDPDLRNMLSMLEQIQDQSEKEQGYDIPK